jgi:outer membrane receptor for ferrienterochelin and colicin
MRLTGSRFAFSASVLSCALALATPAFAQDAAAPAEDDSANEADIVVTGSLIRRPNNTAVSPIVSISAEAIKESGKANLVDALNQLPGFTVAGNESTGGQGTGARASINLHGLGTNRNLVLLDGKRLPVSDIRGNIDINILPDIIIGGVDAITGGASAIYGSDAMSGVVNFKSIKSLDGLLVDAQSTISQRGGVRRQLWRRPRQCRRCLLLCQAGPAQRQQALVLLRQDPFGLHRHRHLCSGFEQCA